MTVTAGYRSLWLGTVSVLILVWLFLQSPSIANGTAIVTKLLIPAQEETEPNRGNINAGADIIQPGEAIPASAWDDWYFSKSKQEGEASGTGSRPNHNDEGLGEPELEHGRHQKTGTEDRPLILYAYYESEFARQNLQFFVDHALHSAADFIFILNGPTDVDSTIIFRVEVLAKMKVYGINNIFVRKRENVCFDLGAHAEVLNDDMGGSGWLGVSGLIPSPNELLNGLDGRDRRPLKDRYKRYIIMNASIRGPFIPLWSNICWSDAYLNKVTDKIKLVGMSYNCHTNRGHVQSMIWATDATGLEVILTPGGINECFANMPAAQEGEVRTTKLLRDNGYDVDVFLSIYHSKDKETRQKLGSNAELNAPTTKEPQLHKEQDEEKENLTTLERTLPAFSNDGAVPGLLEATSPQANTPAGLSQPGDFWKTCTDEDWLGPGSYYGTFVHPYENLFFKSHRHIEDTLLDRLTEWHDGFGFGSWEVCF